MAAWQHGSDSSNGFNIKLKKTMHELLQNILEAGVFKLTSSAD
jgi:hypothetical protein